MFQSWALPLCRLVLLTFTWFVAFHPIPLGRGVPKPAHAGIQGVPALAQGGGPWSQHRKPLHQVVACFGLVLGVTGIFLAFATGPLVPVVTWAVAGVALQICGG